MNRAIITLECPVCKERNYTTTKNKRTMTDKLVLPKFCPVAASTPSTRRRSRRPSSGLGQ